MKFFSSFSGELALFILLYLFILNVKGKHLCSTEVLLFVPPICILWESPQINYTYTNNVCLLKAKYLFLSLFWVDVVPSIQNTLPYLIQKKKISVIEWLPSMFEAFNQMLNTVREGWTKKEKKRIVITQIVCWLSILFRYSAFHYYNKYLKWLTYDKKRFDLAHSFRDSSPWLERAIAFTGKGNAHHRMCMAGIKGDEKKKGLGSIALSGMHPNYLKASREDKFLKAFAISLKHQIFTLEAFEGCLRL